MNDREGAATAAPDPTGIKRNPDMTHTRALHYSPWERFQFRLLGRWPDRVVERRLAAYAADEAEAELSRLREERDEEMTHHTGEAYDNGFANGIAENKARAEAAEARCARLQQALQRTEEAARQGKIHSESGSSTPATLGRRFSVIRGIAREALAGADTPADSQPEEPT